MRVGEWGYGDGEHTSLGELALFFEFHNSRCSVTVLQYRFAMVCFVRIEALSLWFAAVALVSASFCHLQFIYTRNTSICFTRFCLPIP